MPDGNFGLFAALSLLSVGVGAAFLGYEMGKDHEQNACASALLAVGLADVAQQVQPPPMHELPWGVPVPHPCGCGEPRW